MRVVRNTLLHRIFEGTKFECLKDEFIGPTLVAFSNKHPGSAARLFKNFADTHPNFRIKAAAFDGKLIPSKDIDYLALMPTHEEALVRLILTMKEAAGGRLARTLMAFRDKKETEVV
jgi:large subunit ribosomal protein L10